MASRTLRNSAAIVGVGETTYYKHGQSPDPEFKLALKAILNACADAGVDPRDIDGFSGFANDRSESVRLATALGTRNMRFTAMHWGGGGGGTAGAVAHAAAAIHSGLADCVVVFRSLAQGQFARYGRTAYGADSGTEVPTIAGDLAFSLPYGAISPAQRFAMKVRRFMHDYGVKQDAMRAIALAAYHHAQSNPRAIMQGRPLTEEKYDASRWIVEPFHLYDCCMENDGAAAVILMSAERARDMAQKPAYVMAASSNMDYRYNAHGHNAPNYGTADFVDAGPRLFQTAGIKPSDVDVVQAYENFTGGAMMSLCEHGFFSPEETNDVLTRDNLIAQGGRLPLNTSGGHLAECYMHGMNLIIEGARQIRGQSTNQVRDANIAAMIAGPMVAPVSSLLLGSEATL